MSIIIRSLGAYVPEKIVTNDDLSKTLDTSDAWIFPRTGIKERRIAAPDETTSDLGAKAARIALERAGIDAAELDAIVFTSTSPECLFPATGCLVQKKIGAANAFAFDLQAACSGLLFSLETARSFLRGNPELRKVLVVAAEKMSSIVDWTDRGTCILFGDGAAAILLENDGEPGEGDLGPAALSSDGSYFESLFIPAGGSRAPMTQELLDAHKNFLYMDGRLIFKLAVNDMTERSRLVLKKAGMTVDDVDWFIPHQANARIIDSVGEHLGIASEKVFRNVRNYGNTCSATIGIALEDMIKQGLLKDGQTLLLTAMGGGVTKGAALVRWHKRF